MNLLFILFFSFSYQKEIVQDFETLSIENNYFKVESLFKLVETTKKKKVYDITFKVINKTGNDLFYVSSFSKTENEIESFNIKVDNVESNQVENIESNAPPPVSTSEYVDSGGAMKVGTGSSQRTGGGRTNMNNVKQDSKNINMKRSGNYVLDNNIFEIVFSNSKNLKFIPDLTNNPEKSIFFSNKDELSYPIRYNNITDKSIQLFESKNEYDPIICLIPASGITKSSRFEINKKSGQKPQDFSLLFSKDIFYSNKVKLLLDKTYHTTIEDAINKYKELQKVLKNNLWVLKLIME